MNYLSKVLSSAAPVWSTMTLALLVSSSMPSASIAHEGVQSENAAPEEDKQPLRVEFFRLSNGVGVWFVPTSATGILRARIIQRTRSDRACDYPSGTSEIMAALITRGSKGRTSSELDAEVKRLGGLLRSSGRAGEIVVDVGAKIGQLDEMLALWADAVRSPSFDKDEFLKQQAKYAAVIDARSRDTKELSYYALERILSDDCLPLPNSKTIDRIRPADVSQFYRQQFGNSQADIVATGDISALGLRKKLEEALTGWQMRPSGLVEQPTPQPAASSRVILIDKPGAEEALIRVGRIIPPFDPATEPAANLFVAVLGSSFTSRLNTKISEQKKWASYAIAYVQTMPNSRALVVKSPVKVERTTDTIAEIIRETSAITSDQVVSLEELEIERSDGIKRKSSLPWGNDEFVLSNLQAIARYDLPADFMSGDIDELRRVTLSEVQQAGRRLLPNTNMTWVIVGDLSRIERDIRALKIGDVEVQDNFGRKLR